MPSIGTESMAQLEQELTRAIRPLVQALDGTPDRTCTGCNGTFPETPEFFYQTRSTGYYWRCHPCARAYFRAKAQARYERRFGVEIEYAGSTSDAVYAVQSAGYRCEAEGYNHDTASYWKVVSDSSVYDGMELVSPPLRGADGRGAIERVCNAMRSHGCSVNRSCGLHVHHDMRGVTLTEFKRLFRLVYIVQRAMDCFVAPSRRNGEWGQHLTSGDMSQIDMIRSMSRRGVSAACINRFKIVNIDAYPRHGTVEFRSHQGTLNAQKILAWVALGQALIKWAKSDHELPIEPVSNGHSLLGYLKEYRFLADEYVDYLTERIGTLGRVTSAEEAPEPERDYESDDDVECDCDVCTQVYDNDDDRHECGCSDEYACMCVLTCSACFTCTACLVSRITQGLPYGANLSGANLSGADLRGANLSGAILPVGFSMTGGLVNA